MSTVEKTRIRCGITFGDPSGIGPEIIVKALSRPDILDLADFVVIGDGFVLDEFRSSGVQEFRSVTFIDLKNVSPKHYEFGKIKAEYGKASIEYLDKALELVRSKRIDCLVTAPVSKKAISLAGYKFSGHTDYIAKTFSARDAVMMLFNRKLRVSLVTQHIPLKEVSKSLEINDIFNVIKQTSCGLRRFFSIKNPRIAVCGLNPHASDNGLIGDEEKRFIIPAIKKARSNHIVIRGPYPADTIFRKQGEFDAIVCMYHDQGLIPLKLTGFLDAVNITLGLPFVRTSPAHGTGFDIAGKNKANPSSLIEAIKTAVKPKNCIRNEL